MKRLLILTAVAVVTASAIGCNCCGFRRPEPQCNPCNTCDPGMTYGGDPYMAPPVITNPGPVSYGPAQ